METNKTTIYLIPAEVQQFLLFQKNYELFVILEKTGVLNMQYGKAILNIADGKVQLITKEESVYKR